MGRRPARYDFKNLPQPRRRVRPALQDYVTFPWYIKKPMTTPLTYHIITADRTGMTGASTKMKIRPVHSEASRPSQASAFRGAAHDQNKECHDLTGRASGSLTTGIASTYKEESTAQTAYHQQAEERHNRLCREPFPIVPDVIFFHALDLKIHARRCPKMPKEYNCLFYRLLCYDYFARI